MSLKYDKVLKFVTEKHKGQIRRSGEPVINHPIGVAKILKDAGFDEQYQIVGLCHDLLEDTDTTKEKLLEVLDGDVELLEAIISLTKTDDMTLEESINNAKKNQIGKIVKGADRYQNAITTYKDKNTQEFISGFIYKTLVFYIPALIEVNNPFIGPLFKELNRLYETLVPEAIEWLNKELQNKNIKNILNGDYYYV